MTEIHSSLYMLQSFVDSVAWRDVASEAQSQIDSAREELENQDRDRERFTDDYLRGIIAAGRGFLTIPEVLMAEIEATIEENEEDGRPEF